jgi:galactose mutarotase-like enzyme
LKAIHLRTPDLDVVLDPARGGEFQRIARPGGVNALAYHDWRSPLSSDDGPSYGSTELDWLSRYQAGWQILFPNAGAEGVVDGVPVAFHGDTSLARLEVVSVSRTECVLRANARLPLELTRTIRLVQGSATLQIEETVVNVGSTAVPFIWGHHPTFPAVTGARIDSPASRVIVEPQTPGPLEREAGRWPRLRRADGGIEDVAVIPDAPQVRLLYLPELVDGWVALRPPASDPAPVDGVALAWDIATFPHMWLWLQNADPGFPWFGRARMVGLEPQRSWPFDGITGAIARDQHLRLEPGASASSWITLSLFDAGERSVVGVDRDGAVTFES